MTGGRRHDKTHEEAARDLSYAIAQAVHDLRTELNLSQRALADASGTRQPHISRLESARSLPSLDLLLRVAEGTRTRLSVEFKPIDDPHTETAAARPAAEGRAS